MINITKQEEIVCSVIHLTLYGKESKMQCKCLISSPSNQALCPIHWKLINITFQQGAWQAILVMTSLQREVLNFLN